MKLCGMVGHNSGTSRLDFGGNPHLDPDPEFSLSNFTIAILANDKGSSSWIQQPSVNTPASGPRTEQIKGCLVGGLRSPDDSILVFLGMFRH